MAVVLSFLCGAQVALIGSYLSSDPPCADNSFLARELAPFGAIRSSEYDKVKDGKKNSDERKMGELDSVETKRVEEDSTTKSSRNSSSNNNNNEVKKETRDPVGTFNGYNIYYQNNTNIHSSVDCLGENFNSNVAWAFRSCKFRHLCFDLRQKEFAIFQSEEERTLQSAKQKTPFAYLSNLMEDGVSLGGINLKWMGDMSRLKWFPHVVAGEPPNGYYEFDAELAWIPYHSFSATNPGHLIWDDFLPIFTLAKIFGFNPNKLILTRYVLPGPGMWMTCDTDGDKEWACKAMFDKFLPVMGLAATNFSTQLGFRLNLHPKAPPSQLLCASKGAAGVGMLTDHGTKKHGWEQDDYKTMHNHGRGALLWDFRNFIMNNFGISSDAVPTQPPYRIIFSATSSKSSDRSVSFDAQINAVQNHFGQETIVERHEFHKYPVEEQARIVANASIFVTVCGGGAVTGTFLPRGAAVILFYIENGGAKGNQYTGLPARLDWDLFNNLGYIRSHWLPTNSKDSVNDLDLFIKLIRQELDHISHSRL